MSKQTKSKDPDAMDIGAYGKKGGKGKGKGKKGKGKGDNKGLKEKEKESRELKTEEKVLRKLQNYNTQRKRLLVIRRGSTRTRGARRHYLGRRRRLELWLGHWLEHYRLGVDS